MMTQLHQTLQDEEASLIEGQCSLESQVADYKQMYEALQHECKNAAAKFVVRT